MSTNVTADQQAMWDALGILGFDLDGDKTPAAQLAGMGDNAFRAYFLDCAREQRRDYDDAIAETADILTAERGNPFTPPP